TAPAPLVGTSDTGSVADELRGLAPVAGRLSGGAGAIVRASTSDDDAPAATPAIGGVGALAHLLNGDPALLRSLLDRHNDDPRPVLSADAATFGEPLAQLAARPSSALVSSIAIRDGKGSLLGCL